MKKIVIAIVILALLGAGSLTAFLVVKKNQDAKQLIIAEESADKVLFQFDSDDVTSVDIDCPDGVYNAEYTGESWQFTNDVDILPNQDYFTNVASYMSTLTAEKSFETLDEADLSRYGLDDPIVITCRTEEDEYTIYLGNPTPTNDAYYCFVDGKDKVYSIEYSYGSVLYANKSFLKSKYMITYADDEIEEIELIRDDETIYKAKKNESDVWVFDDKYSNLQMDSTKISSMINVLTRLQAEEFVEENLTDYSKYGFDKPYAQMKITGSDGKTHSLLFSQYEEDLDYIYVLIEDSKQVSLFYSFDLDYVEYTVLDVVVNQIYSTYMSTVNTLDINYNGEEINFELDYDNTTYSLNGEDISDLGDDVTTNLYSMYSALSGLKFSEIALDDEVTGEPTITVSYHLDENIDTIMEFIPRDDSTYWLKINDTYTGFLISKSNISGDYSFMYWYDKLVTSIEEAKL